MVVPELIIKLALVTGKVGVYVTVGVKVFDVVFVAVLVGVFVCEPVAVAVLVTNKVAVEVGVEVNELPGERGTLMLLVQAQGKIPVSNKPKTRNKFKYDLFLITLFYSSNNHFQC
jgi:hypothetical protein